MASKGYLNEDQQFNHQQEGWICPRCKVVNAPWVSRCSCTHRYVPITPYDPINPLNPAKPYEPYYPYYYPQYPTITCGNAGNKPISGIDVIC